MVEYDASEVAHRCAGLWYLSKPAEYGQQGIAEFWSITAHFTRLSTRYALPVKFDDMEWYVVEELRRQNHPADSLQFFDIGKNTLQIDCPRIGFELAEGKAEGQLLFLSHGEVQERIQQCIFCSVNQVNPKGVVGYILPDVLTTKPGSDMPPAFASWVVNEY